MATREELFTGLLNILEPDGITSDVSYYAEGRATAEDYENLIKVAFERTAVGSPERAEFIGLLNTAGFFKPSDSLDFWINKATAENALDVQDLQQAAVQRFPTLLASAGGFAADPADDPGLIRPEGAEGLAGIMAGGTLHRIKNEEGQQDFYVVAYEYPPGSGHSFYYRFNDLETLKASIGEDFGGVEIGDQIQEKDLDSWTDGGDSNEILGITGSFTGFINDLTREVAARAGIDDPTRLGKALANEGIQLVMAKAAEGEWSDAQVKAALRNEAYYKDVLYPGIENFYGQTDNPEGAYALYKQNVTSNLETLGVPKDADGSFDSTIADMLNAKISDVKFAAFTPTFLRAQGNDPYRESINKWLAAAGLAPLADFDSFFDLLEGNAPQEINEIVELAGISFIASEQGLNIGENLIREIAERTDLSESQIASSFLESDRDLLALGDAGLRTMGITQAEIIATRAGFTTSDRSLVEMQNLIRKVKIEQGIKDDPTATIFTDFNREGAPIKKGLQSTISEGA